MSENGDVDADCTMASHLPPQSGGSRCCHSKGSLPGGGQDESRIRNNKIRDNMIGSIIIGSGVTRRSLY